MPALPTHAPTGNLYCWRYEICKTFQPNPSTLIVRWRLHWENRPLGGWTVLDERGLPQPRLTAASESVSASLTVRQLQTQLEEAHASLLSATALLPAAGSQQAAAQLAAAQQQLSSGMSIAARLAADVELVDAAVDAADELGSSLQRLRAYLACVTSGSTTLTLDADGCLASHVDTLDFEGILPDWNDDSDGQMDSALDAVLSWCLAHQPPAANAWGWRLDVVRQLFWETFQRSSATDDEVRMSLDREAFDELITVLLFGFSFATVALTSSLAYWLVYVAPELPAQLAAVQGAGVGIAPDAAGHVLAAAGDALSTVLRPKLWS